jgi:hypothetical protein
MRNIINFVHPYVNFSSWFPNPQVNQTHFLNSSVYTILPSLIVLLLFFSPTQPIFTSLPLHISVYPFILIIRDKISLSKLVRYY